MSQLVKDLSTLSRDDLEKKMAELRSQLTEQKRSRAAGELANPHAIKKTRRTLAVALTLFNTTPDKPVKKEEA